MDHKNSARIDSLRFDAREIRVSRRHKLYVLKDPLEERREQEEDVVATNLDMDELEILREEIEALKREALQRVNILADRVSKMEVIDLKKEPSEEDSTLGVSSNKISSPVTRGGLIPPVTLQSARSRVTNYPPTGINSKDDYDLLVGTDWRILLNAGREPGTWMPKTWGVSGERLLINLEVIFEDEQLYEREEFLGSVGEARVLKVLNKELTLGPSVREGSRAYKVRDGGWRIAKGAGPMGTDLLRFYVECGEEIRHKGGDVYVPAGRIYGTCGYFPMNHPRSWLKADLERQLDELMEKAQEKNEEMEKQGPFSFKRMALYRELVQMTIDTQSIRNRLKEAKVRDPDMSLLRLSKARDVGLTREGGICCKVRKGVGYEYHILGRFNINSSDLHMFK